MKILWLSQTPISEGLEALGLVNNYNGAGWMTSIIEKIAYREDIELTIVFRERSIDKVIRIKNKGIDFFIIPYEKKQDKYCKKTESYFKEILDLINPDVIHVFGTENPLALAMVNSSEKNNVIIQITGLVSICSNHYYAGIDSKEIKYKSLGDIIRGRGIRKQKKSFKKRGLYEIKAIKKAKYVLGKTSWDEACVKQINPKIKYLFCNEILRNEFYKYSWDIDKCERYSIFMSQGSYPLKGLHHVLQALPIVIERFPNTKLYVGGINIIKNDTIYDKLRLSSYGLYIKRLIKKNNLENHVEFTGTLSEKEICKKFLKSHVFISASSIENESNSLSEAKILGVPVVSSYVGGIIDRIKHNESGFLYPQDAYYMAAHYIMKIFSDDKLAKKLSKNESIEAKNTNNIEVNISQLIEIYKRVSKDE